MYVYYVGGTGSVIFVYLDCWIKRKLKLDEKQKKTKKL